MVSLMEIMQLCRLCLVKEQVNVPIFEEQDDIRQICLKITSCLPVKITKEDRLPKKICDGCLYKLELLYQFYNTTVNAEKQLLTWLEQINMDASDKNFENLETQSTQPQATVKQEKLEPVESTNENPDMSTDAQNFMLQPESYQPEFTFKESQGSTTDAVDAAENSDEPLAKRPRRGRPRQATKPIPPESLDSSDNDNDNDNDNDAGDSMLEMTVTKTEEESESEGDENVDDPEPTKFEAVGEDTEQPGPSGLGKGGADGPCTLTKVRTINSGKPKRYRGPPHICKKCHTEYKSDKALQRHKKAEHMQLPREYASYSFDEDTKNFTCKICKLESQVKSTMVAHVLTHEQKFTCKVCSATVYSAYRYSVHLYNHNKEAGYKCPLCDYGTWNPPGIFLHITRVHLRRFAYSCKHCKKGYNDIVMYREHENSHVSKQKISCVVCQKEFGYTRYLLAHQKQFHTVYTDDPKLQNQCHVCKKGFVAKRALDKHLIGAHKKSSDKYVHLCEWCGKSFKDKHSLNAHTTYHTGNKPHKCSYCEKTFAKRGPLVMHERIHNGEKPYVCHHCGKAFNQPTALKRHIRSHTGEKPYACGKCGASFTSKMSLNKHSIRGCG